MPIRVLENPFPLIHQPPPRVWIEGRESAFALLDELPARGFAVVGTRAPQKRCEHLLRETLARLRGSRLVILSGLARGIDAIAHEAALETGLPTIAVLAHGIDGTYPPENSRLRERILERGGLVLTEFPPGFEAKPPCFIQRNRIIAGLAHATWVVQAGRKSGALNTATRANELGREVLVTPGFPGDPALAGNEWLIRAKNARPLWSFEDLASTWIELIHLFSQPNPIQTHSPARDPLRILEAELARGATLAEALLACSAHLEVPMESLLRDFENAGLRA